jgi:hypothetical protein
MSPRQTAGVVAGHSSRTAACRSRGGHQTLVTCRHELSVAELVVIVCVSCLEVCHDALSLALRDTATLPRVELVPRRRAL